MHTLIDHTKTFIIYILFVKLIFLQGLLHVFVFCKPIEHVNYRFIDISNSKIKLTMDIRLFSITMQVTLRYNMYTYIISSGSLNSYFYKMFDSIR